MGLTPLDLSILLRLSRVPPQTCFALAKDLCNGTKDPVSMANSIRYRIRKLQDSGLVARTSNGSAEFWGITERVRFGHAHLSLHTGNGKDFTFDLKDTVFIEYPDNRYEVLRFTTE